KYPLATISCLQEILPEHLGLGYDIACSFWSTLMRSSLGAQACQHGLRMVVPAFHGHAHNHHCQLFFHIMISHGFGLEDLETCECVFSGSNAVAQLTRHATPFHQCQFINMFFHQWDAEKYENLAQFIFQNYKQALEVLWDMPVHIESLTSGWHISNAQYSSWLSEEHKYLESKKAETQSDVLGVEYVELLNKYHEALNSFLKMM
ncbi:hypothetical protein K439DRAFT_1345285, partial [Ramaria rubella]